jgi:hypothetical protein
VFAKSNIQPNDSFNGWDGNVNGKPAQPDVFVYILEIVCDNNTIIPVKGNITLIR